MTMVNPVRMPENERQGLDGMRCTVKAAPRGPTKARASKAKGKRTLGQKCPHCAAHLRPLEASVEREQVQCIACDGWIERSHVMVAPCAPPKLKGVDPKLHEAMDEGREAREALALFADTGPGDGCALCGNILEPMNEGMKK